MQLLLVVMILLVVHANIRYTLFKLISMHFSEQEMLELKGENIVAAGNTCLCSCSN